MSKELWSWLKRQTRKFYANDKMLLGRFSKCSTPMNCYLPKTYSSIEWFAISNTIGKLLKTFTGYFSRSSYHVHTIIVSRYFLT